MRIIFRYMLKSICESKLRTILVVFAIMISSAMFFASISISGTLVKMQMELWRHRYGFTDIIIQRSIDSPSPWFYMNRAEEYKSEMEYVIGEMSGYGLYLTSKAEKTGTILKGIDIADLQKLTPFTMEAEKSLLPFKGMKAVISSAAAKNYDLQCGSTMLIEINGSKYRFTICGIMQGTGVYSENVGIIYVTVPLSTLNSLYNARGRVDLIYLKLLHPEKMHRFIYLLSRAYSRYSVREPFTEWEIKRQTDRIAAPVVIVTVILSFMCIYIIHTTFTIIVLERLPVLGTFRSIGAERSTANIILLLESLIYGIIGGLSGCGLGIGLLYIITALSDSATSAGISVHMNITSLQLLSTFGAAILLAVAGSIKPIAKAVRVPIKDIILGAAAESAAPSGLHTVAGIVLLCLSLVIPFAAPSQLTLITDTVCIITLLLAGNLLIPFITDRLLRMMEFGCTPLLGNCGILAVKMLKKNKNMYSGVSMLMIGLSSLYMISTLNWSQLKDIDVSFDRNRYDLTMEVPKADKNTLNLISELEGVQDILGSYYIGRTEIEGFEEPIWHIQGIPTTEFLSFQELRLDGSSKELLMGLDKGRNILLTNTLRNRLELKTGDTILLKFSSGKGGFIRRSYKTTGFFDSILKGKWSYALISDKYFKLDVRNRFYGPIYIKAERNPVDTMNKLKAAFSKSQPVIELKEDARKLVLQSNNQLFYILQGFTLLTLLTGTFGIINNLIISFLQRKRQLAMLRSAGMSRLQLLWLMLIEAAIQGISGGLLGIAAGLTATWIIVPQIIKALATESSIFFSPGITAVCFVTGIILYLLASVGPFIRISKSDLISAIKQE